MVERQQEKALEAQRLKRGILFFSVGLLVGVAAAFFWGKRLTDTRSEAELAPLKAEIHDLHEKLAAREKAWVQFNEDWKTARATEKKGPVSEAPSQPALDVPLPNPDSFPARFNRAMRDQAQAEWTLEECAEVKDGAIREAGFFHRGPQGAVSGLLRCQRASFVLPPSPDAAWLLCQEGYSIEDGTKTALPEEGYRIELAPVRIDELRAALPELFVSGKMPSAPASGEPVSTPAPESGVAVLREKLNALWAADPGGYRLLRLGSTTPRELVDLEIEERSGDSVTARYLAARARPRFDPAGKTVELILEQGSVERKGKTSPIPVSGFRLHFSKVSPAAWKMAGAPLPR